jgi:2-C-methyl-D-erythritol 2,4-cyclodiphosphate synthase
VKFSAGIGYDSHPFLKGRRLVLGGIEIPHEKGLAGHSDADALTHAICDALLGAIGEGDLGLHFPDTDPEYKGISSLKLLEKVSARVAAKGYRISHLDTILIAEEPRLSPHIPRMRETIARTLGLPEEAVNIKAKTNEGMGFIGRGEGIAAQAIGALIKETA